MFKSLRLKLTFLTVAVIIALFTFFSALLYMQISYNSERGTTFGLEKITEEVIAKKLTDFPAMPEQPSPNRPHKSWMLLPARPNFFFVKTTDNGAVTYASRGVTIDDAALSRLVQTTHQQTSPKAVFSFENADFAFLKTKLPHEDGYLIVYNDLRNQTKNMAELLHHLIITGILSALLAWLLIYRLSIYVIRPIERSVEQQQHFVSDASHELRTPLTILQTNLDILKGALPGETIAENQKWLQNIQTETTRMTELINTLLFLARADANQQLLEKEYFPLKPLLTAAADAFVPLAQQKNIDISCTASDTLTALGDAVRLQQVLTILLDNALRHTPCGGSVKIKADSAHSQLTITVTDTGEGIAAKHLPKIFDRFYQADESRHKGGAGLGLSLAKWIIDKHGGQIHAASVPSQGSTFTITLPL